MNFAGDKTPVMLIDDKHIYIAYSIYEKTVFIQVQIDIRQKKMRICLRINEGIYENYIGLYIMKPIPSIYYILYYRFINK